MALSATGRYRIPAEPRTSTDIQVNGKKLTDNINRTHLNSRYLPDIPLPKNLVATPRLNDVVKDATLIVFVTPHQFLHSVLRELAAPGVITPGARGVTAIKGVEVDGTDISTFASVIEHKLRMPCSALSGANIALEVAKEQFCETTIGVPAREDGELWDAVFDAPSFRVSIVDDVSGVSLSGALKNVVALAAGFIDGLGLGGNTKAAILRIGLQEMREFCLEFFEGSKAETYVYPFRRSHTVQSHPSAHKAKLTSQILQRVRRYRRPHHHLLRRP